MEKLLKGNKLKTNEEQLLDIIAKYIKEHKDLRFIQALWSLGIIDKEDRFYETTEQTLKRIKGEK